MLRPAFTSRVRIRRPSSCLSARSRATAREREAFQEIDYRAMFGSMTKWATEIDDPARIPEIVSRAFHTAANGRPGPVVVSLPEDMLTERIGVDDATAYRADRDLAR